MQDALRKNIEISKQKYYSKIFRELATVKINPQLTPLLQAINSSEHTVVNVTVYWPLLKWWKLIQVSAKSYQNSSKFNI